MSAFIDVKNMRALLTSLHTELVKRGPYAIEYAEEHSPVKKVIFDIMRDMANDPTYEGLNISYMNDLVLDAALNFYTSVIPPSPVLVNDAQDDSSWTENSNVADVPKQNNSPRDTSHPTTSVYHCISIDGISRDVGLYPDRYRFVVHLSEPCRSLEALQLNSVIIAMQDHSISCPYLILIIEEISGVYSLNDSDPIRRAFSKVIPVRTYESMKGRTYLVLEPACIDKKSFDPPLPSLSRFTVTIRQPNGQLVSTSQDSNVICKIVRSSDGNWILITESFWPVQDFERGDVVNISGVFTGVDAFDVFLNRQEGHIVLDRAMLHAEDGCNKIIVRHAGKIDPLTGAYTVDEDMVHAFDGSNENSTTVGEISVKGRLINSSVQVSATMTATCTSSIRHKYVDGNS